MIADGVTVLAIVNLDSESGAAIQEKAAAAGRQDHRLRPAHPRWLGGRTTCPSTTSSSASCRARASSSASAARQRRRPDDRLPQRLARPTTTRRCSRRAAHSVLDPISNYDDRRRAGRSGLGQRSRPAPSSSSCYTAAGGKVDGVLAANDGLGARRDQQSSRRRPAGKVPVTGQDATVEGLQNILAGHPVHDGLQVRQAGGRRRWPTAAIALVNGEDAETTGTTSDTDGRPRRPVDPARAASRSPRTTSRTSSTTVCQTADDVCAGEFADLCAEAGICLTGRTDSVGPDRRRPGRHPARAPFGRARHNKFSSPIGVSRR